MISQRKKNQLDNFLINERLNKPEVINLPNRCHSPQQYTHINNGNINHHVMFPAKQNYNQVRNISPSKLNAKNKPVMSPNTLRTNQNKNQRYKGNNNHQWNTVTDKIRSSSNTPEIAPSMIQHIKQHKQLGEYKNNMQQQQLIPKANQYGNSHRVMLPSAKSKLCLNHDTRMAEFLTCLNQQNIYYCGRCAAQLASQGFKVQRIGETAITNAKMHKIPHLPQYEGNPIYEQIIQFLQVINTLELDIQTNVNKFTGLQQHYEEQIKITQNFYNIIEQIVQQMKTDHLQDLYAECQENTQIAAIQNDHLEDSINQINSIRNDIEINMEELVAEYNGMQKDSNIDEFRKCFDYYKQKIQIIKLSSEEQFGALKEVTTYESENLDKKTKLFEQQLMALWNDQQQHFNAKENQYQCFQNHKENKLHIINAIHHGTNIINGKNDGKSAFRNLFGENEQTIGNQISPQFKII